MHQTSTPHRGNHIQDFFVNIAQECAYMYIYIYKTSTHNIEGVLSYGPVANRSDGQMGYVYEAVNLDGTVSARL